MSLLYCNELSSILFFFFNDETEAAGLRGQGDFFVVNNVRELFLISAQVRAEGNWILLHCVVSALFHHMEYTCV